jgi:pyruvate kinase
MVANRIVKSKTVCTIGPATDSEENLKRLAANGCDIIRVNFSHVKKDGSDVIELLARVRRVVPQLGLLCDIQGPKIRIGQMEQPVTLKHGDKFTIYHKEIVGNQEKASISYDAFIQDVAVGEYIFINDGLVRLEVIEKYEKEEYVVTKVIAGGTISSKKGVNIPSAGLNAKNPTDQDINHLRLMAPFRPEYVAASFIGAAKEARIIRQILDNEGASTTKIISKIERPIALVNFDEILDASDGIMVARGDLGVEIAAEDVPIRQKEMIRKCNKAGKPVIVATQMLESMINNPVPTRAEVNDVFNAIYDRSDAVMLSGETSVGKFPFEAVKYMELIGGKAEKYIQDVDPMTFDSSEPEIYETVGHAVYELAEMFQRVNFRGCIVAFTRGGRLIRMIAKYRPHFPILAITNDVTTARQLNLVWGVKPVFIPSLQLEDWPAEEVMQYGIKKLVEFGYIDLREHIICAVPSRISPGRCAVMGVYYAEDILKGVSLEDTQDNQVWPS